MAPLALALSAALACGEEEPQKFSSLLVPNLTDEEPASRGVGGTAPVPIPTGKGGTSGSSGGSAPAAGTGGSSIGVAGSGGSTEVSDYYDAATGLTWRHGGTAIDAGSAASICSGLTTSSYESFRLPDIDELRTLVTGCYDSGPDGSCSVSTSCYGNSCWSDSCGGCGDLGCVAPAAVSSSCGRTWSSTSADSGVWNIDFRSGAIGWGTPGEFAQVLCVQGSPLPPTCTPTSFSTAVLAYPSSTESTGYQVCSGQGLNFSASGTWCSSGVDCSGPEGISGRPYPEEQPVTLSGANLGALVGKVGDSYFTIGFGGLVYAPASGTLELLMNDRIGYYGDNTGSLTVYVDAY